MINKLTAKKPSAQGWREVRALSASFLLGTGPCIDTSSAEELTALLAWDTSHLPSPRQGVQNALM